MDGEDEDEDDDWTSTDTPKPSKKTSSGGAGLFGDLEGGEDEDVDGLFDEPEKKKSPATKKKKVSPVGMYCTATTVDNNEECNMSTTT